MADGLNGRVQVRGRIVDVDSHEMFPAQIWEEVFGDIKEANGKFYVIEINDNPNLEHGVEDEADKAVWHRLTEWFVKRLNA